MTLHTAALCKLYIGPTLSIPTDPSTLSASDFTGLSYTVLGEIEDISEYGDKVGITTFTALNNRRVRKVKTSFDSGNITVTLARDAADAGQIAAKAAQLTDFDYAFKIEFNDASAGSPASNSMDFFAGKLTDFMNSIGTVENILKRTVGIALNTPIISVAAV